MINMSEQVSSRMVKYTILDFIFQDGMFCNEIVIINYRLYNIFTKFGVMYIKSKYIEK